MTGQKHDKLVEIWRAIKLNGPPFVFDNLMVKTTTGVDFGNQYDLTKLDTSAKLPAELRADDVFIVHLGGPRFRDPARRVPTRHRFVSPISVGYHRLEPIQKVEDPWKYRRTILDNLDEGESGTISVVFNQGIIHDFLFEDRTIPGLRIHIPGRTRKKDENTFTYRVGSTEVSVEQLQIEMDFIVEKNGTVAIAEAKRGDLPEDFAVSQIYLPYRKLLKMKGRLGGSFEIRCLFLFQYTRPDRREGIRVYEYAFNDPEDMGSIALLKSCEYVLAPS
jgi:hypothetical protein